MTQASFRLVRKGYEPSEVDQRVAQLSASIQQLQSDLARAHDDNAVQAVENTKLRQANSDLAGRIEMLEQAVQEVRDERDNGVPPTFANLGGRIGQMLTLAQEEADELRSTAQAEAEKLTASGNILTEAPNDGTKQWLNKRTGEVETLPAGIDPGWDYNPGKSRSASMKADLAEKEVRLRQTLSAPL